MFGSFGAGFGSFGAGVGGLLPSFTNITSWLKTPTADGKTLDNSKGADATLTGVNCLQYTLGTPADYVALTNDITTSNPWELEFDINWSHFGNTSSGVSFISTDDESNWFRINGVDGNNLFLEGKIGNTLFREFDISADVTLSLNVTYRIKTVWSGTSVALYVDGVLKNTYNWVNNVENNTFGNIGRPVATQGTAKIANWKFTHNGVVEAHIPLQEGSGTKAYDISGNGNHGVIVNSTWTTADGIESWNHQYGFSGNAVFDGTDDYIQTGVVANDNYTLEFRAKIENDNAFMGSFNLVDRFFIGRNTSNILRLGYKSFNNTTAVNSSIYSKLTTYKIQNGVASIDGVEVLYSNVSPTGATVGELYIGARNLSGTADSFAQSDLEYYRIYDDSGVLVRDFVPSPNGLYDKVNGVYYSNDGTGTITVKRIPALNIKTTQVINFDGVADEVGTNYSPGGSDLVIDARVKIDTVTGQRTLYSVNGNSGFWFRINNGEWQLYSRNAFIFSASTGIDPAVGNIYDTRVEYDYSTGDWIARVKLSTDSTYTTVGSGNRLPPIINFEPVVLGQKGSTGYFDGQYHSLKITEGGVTQVEYDFQNDIGTTNIVDSSGINNDGIVSVGSGGLDSFWGKRIPDSAGSLVSANYAIENGSTIINPAGFVHNGSECGVDMVSNDLTSTELFQINNSTATETFVRKDNGNIVQILDYSAPLTGDDLTRTRNYVG